MLEIHLKAKSSHLDQICIEADALKFFSCESNFFLLTFLVLCMLFLAATKCANMSLMLITLVLLLYMTDDLGELLLNLIQCKILTVFYLISSIP